MPSWLRRSAVIAITGMLLISGQVRAATPEEEQRAREEAATKRLIEARKAREAAAKAAAKPATAPATLPAAAAPGSQPAVAAPKSSNRIVFLVDTSGSMSNMKDDIAEEVSKAISGLKAPQVFDVVMCNDGKAWALSPAMLQPSDANRAAAFRALRTANYGSTDGTMAGIELSAKLKPDVVWLLTDGDFPDEAAFKKKASVLAKGGHFRVNTSTKFASPHGSFDDILRVIATECGGVAVDVEGKKLPPLSNHARGGAVGVGEPMPGPAPTGRSSLAE